MASDEFYNKTAVDGLIAGISGGGAGGGPKGLTLMHMPTMDLNYMSGSGYTEAQFDSWSIDNKYGEGLGILSPAGSHLWSFDQEGWYQLAFKVWLGFTANTTPLPDLVQLDYSNWYGLHFVVDMPVLPPSGSGSWNNRTYPGVTATFTTPAFFAPGAVEAPAEDGPNYVKMGWLGDAVATNGNGGPANPLSIFATRLA